MTPYVLLVGNSASLLERESGGMIDSAWKIVRFNGGRPDRNQISIGSRTDYWSFSTLVEAQYIEWKIPGATQMCLNMRIDYPFVTDAIFNDAETYRDLIDGYGHPRPSTGLMTAHYITRKWDCGVACIGFDFFKSGTWYRGSNANIPHDGGREREYMLSLGVEVM